MIPAMATRPKHSKAEYLNIFGGWRDVNACPTDSKLRIR